MEVLVLLLLIATWDVPDHQDRCLTTSPKKTVKRETSKQMVGDRNMPLGLLQKKKKKKKKKMMMMMMTTKILMINCLIVGLVTL